MTYLLAKYTLIFLLAALLGALLGYWWSRRKLIDVSENYEALIRRQKADGEAWQDLSGRVTTLNDNLAPTIKAGLAELPEPTFPVTDLSGLERQLAALKSQFDAFEIPEAKETDLSGVLSKIDAVNDRVSAIKIPTPERVDLAPIQARVDGIEGLIAGIRIPEPKTTDLTGLESRLEAVDARVGAIRIPAPEKTDLSPIEARLDSVEQLVKSIHIPEPERTDLSSVVTRLDALETSVRGIHIPKPVSTDLSPVSEKLRQVETRISQLVMPKPVDLNPVHSRLQAVEKALANVPTVETHAPTDLKPVHQRIDELERLLKNLPAPKTIDIAPLGVRLTAIEAAIAKLNKPAPKPKKEGPILLKAASYGRKDDLKKISGVGPKLERMLNGHGVYYFWQVADWSARDIRIVDDKLEVFKGRIARDNWVTQAKQLRREAGAAQKPS